MRYKMSNVYISKALRKDIPKDAVLLTRDEAVEMHWNTIMTWKPEIDTWPFRYGIGALTGLSGSTSYVISQYYRQKLKLGTYGRITMLLPTIVLPTIAATWGHFSMVTNDIFLAENCPLCIQTRAALLQSACAVGIPTLLSPFAAFGYALFYGTYNVPVMSVKNVPDIVRLTWKLISSLRSRIPISIALNSFTAMAVTYFEANSFYHIQCKIQQNEERFRKSIYG